MYVQHAFASILRTKSYVTILSFLISINGGIIFFLRFPKFQEGLLREHVLHVISLAPGTKDGRSATLPLRPTMGPIGLGGPVEHV
jgi:hypothetical protein